MLLPLQGWKGQRAEGWRRNRGLRAVRVFAYCFAAHRRPPPVCQVIQDEPRSSRVYSAGDAVSGTAVPGGSRCTWACCRTPVCVPAVLFCAFYGATPAPSMWSSFRVIFPDNALSHFPVCCENTGLQMSQLTVVTKEKEKKNYLLSYLTLNLKNIFHFLLPCLCT